MRPIILITSLAALAAALPKETASTSQSDVAEPLQSETAEHADLSAVAREKMKKLKAKRQASLPNPHTRISKKPNRQEDSVPAATTLGSTPAPSNTAAASNVTIVASPATPLEGDDEIVDNDDDDLGDDIIDAILDILMGDSDSTDAPTNATNTPPSSSSPSSSSTAGAPATPAKKNTAVATPNGPASVTVATGSSSVTPCNCADEFFGQDSVQKDQVAACAASCVLNGPDAARKRFRRDELTRRAVSAGKPSLPLLSARSPAPEPMPVPQEETKPARTGGRLENRSSKTAVRKLAKRSGGGFDDEDLDNVGCDEDDLDGDVFDGDDGGGDFGDLFEEDGLDGGDDWAGEGDNFNDSY